MKQYTNWLATAVAVASGLTIANSAQAQYVNGDPFLDNITINGGNAGATSVGASGLTVAQANDTYFYAEAGLTPQNYAGDNEVIWTYTINSPTPGTTGAGYPAAGAWSWTGITILLSNDGGATDERYPASGYDSPFLTYSPINGQGVANTDPGYSYNPATQQVTQIAMLDANTLAQIASGPAINEVQFSIDSSESLPNGYSLTFNSIELVPEPATLALVGLGLAGLVIARRRVS